MDSLGLPIQVVKNALAFTKVISLTLEVNNVNQIQQSLLQRLVSYDLQVCLAVEDWQEGMKDVGEAQDTRI